MPHSQVSSRLVQVSAVVEYRDRYSAVLCFPAGTSGALINQGEGAAESDHATHNITAKLGEGKEYVVRRFFEGQDKQLRTLPLRILLEKDDLAYSGVNTSVANELNREAPYALGLPYQL